MKIKKKNVTKQSKWLTIFRSVLAVVFGILILAWPVKTLAVAISLFVIFAILDGIGAILFGIFDRDQKTEAMQIFPFSNGQIITIGIVELTIAFLIVFWPEITLIVVVYHIGALFLIYGVSQFALTFSKKSTGELEKISHILSSILLVGFAMLIFSYPAWTTVALFWGLGIFLVVHGIIIFLGVFTSKSDSKRARLA